MTAGSIIVFSNGDRKMAANEEAIFSLRVYRAMTGEMTPASNVKEELSRVFSRVRAQQPLLCNPRVNYGSNGSSGKNGRLKPTSWKETRQKRVCIVSLCDSSTAALRHCGTAASSIRLTNSDLKVKNDPRSKFSNLSNWKEEA